MPNIIHSDAEHWDSVLQKMMQVLGKEKFNSDMILLRDAREQFGDKDLGITQWQYNSTGFIYERDEDGQLVINCQLGKNTMVAHLSHDVCHKAFDKGVYPKLEGEEVTNWSSDHRRHEAALKMLADFRSICLDK